MIAPATTSSALTARPGALGAFEPCWLATSS